MYSWNQGQNWISSTPLSQNKMQNYLKYFIPKKLKTTCCNDIIMKENYLNTTCIFKVSLICNLDKRSYNPGITADTIQADSLSDLFDVYKCNQIRHGTKVCWIKIAFWQTSHKLSDKVWFEVWYYWLCHCLSFQYPYPRII